MEELKRIADSEITKEDDVVGWQELEFIIRDEHNSFTTSEIGSAA